MIISINGTDKSAYATKYGCYEVPRRVYGPNGDTAKNGDEIVDFLKTKYDIVFELAPIKSPDLAWFTALLEDELVSVTYFSDARNRTVTSLYIPEISQIQPAIVNGDTKLLYPIILTLKEK